MELFLWDWGTLIRQHSHTAGLGQTRAEESNSGQPRCGELSFKPHFFSWCYS